MNSARIGYLLLMVIVMFIRVSGGSLRDGPAEDCQDGFMVDRAYHECLGSTTQASSLPALANVVHSSNATKADIMAFLQEFCTEVLPATKTCFLEEIVNCEEAAKDRLREAATSMNGLVCQSSGSGIHPAIQEVFSLISDEEIRQAVTGRCRGVRTGVCVNEAVSTSDLGGGGWTTEAMLTAVSLFEEVYIRCIFGVYGQQADSCWFWRSAALLKIGNILLPPTLGSRLPYTARQIKDMLQL